MGMKGGHWGKVALMAGVGLAGLLGLYGHDRVRASGDYGCAPFWQLRDGMPVPDGEGGTCGGRAMLSPGNDTRINLLLLIRSLQDGVKSQPALPAEPVDDGRTGKTFFTWKGLRAAFWPHKDEDTPYNAACVAPAGAVASFNAALNAAKGLSAADKAALMTTRAAVGCTDKPYAAPTVTTTTGRDYAAYLAAADAYYRKDYAAAAAGFAPLAKAGDPWVAQTAAYMPIRVAFALAEAKAYNEYGDFAGADKVDQSAVAKAGGAIDAYLRAWPKGMYAASAEGLKRRVLWLKGDKPALAREYERLLATTPADSEDAAILIEEIDVKLVNEKAYVDIAKSSDTPMLLTMIDLMRLRRPLEDKPVDLTRAELDAQAPAFAKRPDLWAYLNAAYSYYGAGDAKQILTLLPDHARAPAYTPLGFSAQMLRGMALAQLNDRNEPGFWRELMGGAAPVHQRPLVELGLAQALKARGQLAAVFAPNSAITDATTREMLLQSIAPPAILRTVAGDATRPAHERDLARFTLVYKGLTRGAYGDVSRDLALIAPKANTDAGLWSFQQQAAIPTGVFTAGKWSDGFACPALPQTVATLAKAPADRHALLCLGDFYRLNGFDNFDMGPNNTVKGTLDSGADQFPGKPAYRESFYAAILSDKGASAEERAYALYRSIMCYAPSGSNGCAAPSRTNDAYNQAQAPKSQRKAWYDELKGKYPASPWAKKLRYYW